VFSPATAEREIDHPNDTVREMREGWNLLWTMIESDLAALLRRLQADPSPLCAAMARYPQTVIHGDPRGANIGIVRGTRSRVVLLDWHFVGPGVPGVDLTWYLLRFASRVSASNETTIAWYRERLAQRLGSRFAKQWWRPQLELSLLGEMVRSGDLFGWEAAHHPDPAVREWTRQCLSWWSERAREGARWL
jgi:hypothetical protein